MVAGRVGLALAVVACWGCVQAKTEPVKRLDAAPVTIATAQRKSVPVEIRTIGSVQAYATVAIRSRVGGQIMKVGFQEGQDVKKGDLLFTIDRRPLEAVLAQAKATLARDMVNKLSADADQERYKKLVESKTVTEEVFLQFKTKADAFKATVDADQAVVDAAAVMLDYSTIRAPIDGRTGDLLVDEGNIVKADDTVSLVVIHQIVPIYVAFSVPEQHLPEVRKYQEQKPLQVATFIPNDPTPVRGELTLIDNAVDRATGTIQLKATFANRDKRLWPGQFVNMILQLTTVEGATVAPTAAIQTGQQGSYVFVVGADDTAQLRPVVTGVQAGGEVVISTGVAPGDRVVTDGQLRLTAGTKVSVKNPPPAGKSGPPPKAAEPKRPAVAQPPSAVPGGSAQPGAAVPPSAEGKRE